MSGRFHSGRAALALIGALAVVTALAPGSARSAALEEALALAYIANPTLNAARARLRATDELVPQARALGLPTVEIAGDAGAQWSATRGQATTAGGTRTATRRDTLYPYSIGLTVIQPIYRGGRISASINNAENLVDAERGRLMSTEQSVLLAGATAYFDVLRDSAVVDLNVNNEQVLSRQLQASRDRFEVGEITRTDVSQAESRRARSTADRFTAEGTLRSSRAVFERVVGDPPVDLVPPSLRFYLPATREQAVEIAEALNPDVLTALAVERAARNQIDVANSERLPQLSIVGNAERGYNQSTLTDRADAAGIVAQLRIPLYQGGGASARVREARHTANQRLIEIDQARRQSREAAIRAWETLAAARAAITALEAQVRAAEIALEGVRQEALVGSRTTLDILDAEQELLDAQVGLVRARRDEAVASFQLLSALGQLTAPALNLNVDIYDPQANYRKVRNKLYGTSINGYGNGPEGRR